MKRADLVEAAIVACTTLLDEIAGSQVGKKLSQTDIDFILDEVVREAILQHSFEQALRDDISAADIVVTLGRIVDTKPVCQSCDGTGRIS